MTFQLLAMSVKTVKVTDYSSQREIAAGGEGKIFEHPSDKDQVVKIYHKPRDKKFIDHLTMLSSLAPNFIKPIDILIDTQLKVLGFTMKYVDFNDYFLFNNLFNKGFCNSNGITKKLKIQILDTIAEELKELDKQHIQIGDLNQYNIFIGKGGEVLFVDVDSYQTSKNAHSGVLLDDIRDWTTNKIDSQTDIYAFDVLAFWTLTFCHPYKWVVPGNKDSLEMRVKAFKSILSNIKDIKIPALYEPPTGELLKQFTEIFNHGRRYLVSLTGVHVPVSTMVKQQVSTSNNLTIKKLYDGVYDVFAIDECISVKTSVLSWKLVETMIPKVTREIVTIHCDELYPAQNGNYAYKVDDQLFSATGSKLVFNNPVFYYNNGFLCVIEYNKDLQWNYNINNQLVGGIDNTNTPVFAKSIVKRDGLIQNFGSQIFLNVPMYNRYSMIGTFKGTKNGYYLKGFTVIEHTNKRNVSFTVTDTNKLNSIDLDYFPYIAVNSVNNMVFIPEDGYVDIYTNLQLLTRLECPVCTRDSKLYYTKAGIFLLEDQVLYLLNTK